MKIDYKELVRLEESLGEAEKASAHKDLELDEL